MYKKILLLSLVLMTLNADGVQDYLKIKEQTASQITFENSLADKAWIGIYKADTTNDWENVQYWAWATSNTTAIRIGNLQNDVYEARLFYNNSFETEESVAFTHNGGPGAFYTPLSDATIPNNQSAKFTLTFNERVVYPIVDFQEEADWVGIYKKEDTPSSNTLLAWGYLTKINTFKSEAKMETLDHKELDVGEYKMVYHYNNNYKQIGLNKTLTVTKSNILYDTKFSLVLDDYRNTQQDLDWIAIFRKDAEPLKENIVAWAYIKDIPWSYNSNDEDSTYDFYFKDIPASFKGEPYTAILYANDSYEIIGQTP